MPRVTIGNIERGTSYTLFVGLGGELSPTAEERTWPALETPPGHVEAGPLGEIPRVQEFNGSFYVFNIDSPGSPVTARAFGTRAAAESAVREWRSPQAAPSAREELGVARDL